MNLDDFAKTILQSTVDKHVKEMLPAVNAWVKAQVAIWEEQERREREAKKIILNWVKRITWRHKP